ncbi:MAG: adenine phosphoribosyltransferase [Christensenellaceae bacterium]|jgi:adenine phosphoribosyltransferase|nr:adenine phosphoribosyltransferase [Christensenellaceae bacterium]
MEKGFYSVNIAGLDTQLPFVEVTDGVTVAFLNLHGKPNLTEHCALKLAELAKCCDVILTAESKGLQLGHCVARNLGHEFYAVARKAAKQYMRDGIFVTVKSMTTEKQQTLFLSAEDASLLAGKNVAIIDDVISTGDSLAALEELTSRAGGIVVEKLFVLAEGNAADRPDIKYLAKIPLF